MIAILYGAGVEIINYDPSNMNYNKLGCGAYETARTVDK